MKIEEGELIPGVALGQFYIGMEKKQALQYLNGDYTERNLGEGDTQIVLENALMWFDRGEHLTQIGVTEGFRGVYKNTIKIGTTLQEVQDVIGAYEEKYDTYNIVGLEGMCFELADNDIDEEWIELEAPIEWIFIYDSTDKSEEDFDTIKNNTIYPFETSIPNDDMPKTGGIRTKNNINKIIAFMGKHKKLIQFCFLIAMIVLFIWYQNNHLVTTTYAYKSNKISADTNKFSIVQISDLHNASFGKNNKRLINDIEGLKPDIVVITGDIVDSNHTDISSAINFVSEVAGKYPVYYVTGNHEYWLGEAGRKELFAGIRDAGAVILDNENISIAMDTGYLNLIGLDDESLHDATLRSIMEKCNENELTVVLAHEPQYIEQYSVAGADLVLTGHAHGGQMILPLIGPLIAPDQGFFPKYTDGQFERESTTMYVSRGLGNSVIPVRLFNYPEIVCIEIEGTR